MYYASRALGIAVLTVMAAAAWFSVRLARAEAQFRKGTPEGVARAVKLAPRDTTYLSLRALQVDYDGGDDRPLLERMVALNPLSSAPRIRLGLDAEARGDNATAERWLLDAARVDRQFEPRWTLANFYFRRQQTAAFWKWMRAALEVSYGDRRPAFELCWRVSSSPGEILSRAIPQRREVIAAYLSYLLGEHRTAAAAPVARQLASWHDPDDRPLLYGATDALLDAAQGDAVQGDAAAGLWTALGFPPPEGVTAPDFAASGADKGRTGHGFSWRLLDVPGVTHVPLDAPPAHRIQFNGQQPESCELLRQFVRLHAGAHYLLRWESRTSGFDSQTGLTWTIAGQPAALRASGDWLQGQAEFTPRSDLDVLALRYQRPIGEVRAEGYVDLRHVEIVQGGAEPR
jgi:hypothetical protein